MHLPVKRYRLRAEMKAISEIILVNDGLEPGKARICDRLTTHPGILELAIERSSCQVAEGCAIYHTTRSNANPFAESRCNSASHSRAWMWCTWSPGCRRNLKDHIAHSFTSSVSLMNGSSICLIPRSPHSTHCSATNPSSSWMSFFRWGPTLSP